MRKTGAEATKPVSELESHLGFWLRFVSNHVSERFRAQVEAAGVSVSEWVAMRRLYAGDASSAELISALAMTKGAVSKIVTRLEQKGLVIRTEVAADRRAQRLKLSARGRTLVPRLAQRADENDSLFFGHLSQQARADLVLTMRDIVHRQALRTVPVD